MKRSEINGIMRRAQNLLNKHHFKLPPWAYWSPDAWRMKGSETAHIVANRLGWDITDFGGGDFARFGLFLFTIRNGDPNNWRTLSGKLYAEKIMITEVGQGNPMHFHWSKMEDIINRGGGELVIQVYYATPEEELDEHSEVVLSVDGIERSFPAGGTVRLRPGESVTLPQRCYHRFWAEGETVLMGEVSMVNDDNLDNRFQEAIPRFPAVEEDEPPLYLLCTDYPRYLAWAQEKQ